jgi:hypothetical protein
MTEPAIPTDVQPSPWAWALFVAASAFALASAALLGFDPLLG